MFRKAVNKRIDERLGQIIDTLVASVSEGARGVTVDALADAQGELAKRYLELEHRHRAIQVAFTAVVGTDWTLLTRARRAYFDEFHNPHPQREIPWTIRELLKTADEPRPYAAPKSG